MKFIYHYRTAENQLRSGIINAADRESVFVTLKTQGIKPSRVEEAPGVINKVLGKGKRWIAICILSVLAVAMVLFAISLKREIDDLAVYEKRNQIYGDPALLSMVSANGWAAVFPSVGDRFLAAYAIPGRDVYYQGKPPIKVIAEAIKKNVEIFPDDYTEVATIKRMVNGIKREARQYLSDGGSVEGYVKRLARRQREEAQYYMRVRTELSRTNNAAVWQDRNEGLRAMGLPMIEGQISPLTER